MAKKAKLDILEISGSQYGQPVPNSDELTATDGHDAPSDAISKEGYLSKTVGFFFRPLFLIVLIGIGILALTTFIGIVYYRGTRTQIIPSEKERSVLVTPLMEARRMPLFENMVIDQKDLASNIRVVFCDVALDLTHYDQATDIKGDRADVRSVIFSVLQNEMAEEGLSSDGRKRLKEKIKNELNGLFNKNLVKEVYFARYELN